ncbi:MAG: hypothetical protein ACR2LN_04045 [Candidatus Levyibacteriota bacterium]
MAEATNTAREAIQGQVLNKVDTAAKTDTRPERLRLVRSDMDKGVKERRDRDVLESYKKTLGVTNEQKYNTQALFSNPVDATRAGNQIDAVNKYVTEGFDRLTDPEKMTRRADVTRALGNNPVMGEYMRDLATPGRTAQETAERRAQGAAVVDGVLQDEHLQGLVNKNIQKIAKMRFTPKPKEVAARQLAMDAVGGHPAGTTTDVQATQAMGTEFQQNVQNKMNNVVGDSVHEMIRTNLDAAEAVVVTNGEALEAGIDEEWMKNEIKGLKDRWKDPNAYKKASILMDREEGAVRSDWRDFSELGLDGLPLTAEARAYLDARPDVKEKFEAQVGEALLLRRMRAGQFKKDDMVQLIDQEWLGDTQDARISKIKNIMFDQHAGYKSLMGKLQAEGISEKDVWDKVKAAGPGVAAGGMLAALLMLFGIPSAAIIGGAMKLGLGAAAGGGAMYGAAKLRDAA